MFCIIYKIVNLINNKVYIGQTWQSIEKRFKQHLELNSGCIKLGNAVIKYGKDNFIIKPILITSTQIIADYWEDFFINKYDSINKGYNIRYGGSHGKMSIESKLKMSISQTGKKQSDETKKKKSLKMKNNTNALGKKLSDYTRKKMSDSRKLTQAGEGNYASKLTWEIIREIRSSLEKSGVLAQKYNISSRTIRSIRAYETWKEN